MENQSWGTPKLKGRGMVKWQPFASMPEQYEGIRDILSDLNKISRPIVTEDMKEQIERSLIHSVQSKEEISISFYRDGMIQDMYINVLHIEPMLKTVYCTDAFGLNTEFKFNELVSINLKKPPGRTAFILFYFTYTYDPPSVI
ncbi:YolD-like family protein (plasmid) [Bacillus mycoides]|nr:YolD-like family protein [Bacillus mycoides]